MTPQEFYARMSAIRGNDSLSEAQAHEQMDELMCMLLSDLGYTDGVDVFRKSGN